MSFTNISFSTGLPVLRPRDKFPYCFDEYLHWGIPLCEIKGKYELVYHDRVPHRSASKVHPVSKPMAELILKEAYGDPVEVLSIGIACHQMHGFPINIFAYRKLTISL